MPDLICTSCGARTRTPRTITRGSIGVELVLWLALLVPGLLYSVWRHTTRSQACPSCGSTALIPTGSPVGQRLVSEHGSAIVPGAAESTGVSVGRFVGRHPIVAAAIAVGVMTIVLRSCA